MAELGGADGIVIHLREDRRHIQERDVRLLMNTVTVPINLEMACVDDVLAIAVDVRPQEAMLVPERREEVTTEGGLDVHGEGLGEAIKRLCAEDIDVSLFIDPDVSVIARSVELGASTVELHTGDYCEARGDEQQRELARLRQASTVAREAGLKVAAGHGLDYPNVEAVAAIAEVEELNIGHAIIARAIYVGLDRAIRDMLALIERGDCG